MRVTLVGMGCAGTDLPPQARQAIEGAELVVGSARLLASAPTANARTVEATRADEVTAALRDAKGRSAAVLLSGDVGFFSGATKLVRTLSAEGHEVDSIAGVSCVQLLAARLGRPWQGWTLASAHGRDCDVVDLLRKGRPLFLLTSGSATVRSVCAKLVTARLDACVVTVAERLGYDDERIRTGDAAHMFANDYDDLNVMLVELPASMVARRRTPGIPDDDFVRGKVPMTKQEVRACILAKLAVTPKDVCWDVGAGTGATSVELALASKETWAIEQSAAARALVWQNRELMRAWNLHVVAGSAPEVLGGLPRPDVVFVGGSSGKLPKILDAACEANPDVRLCVSSITLETLNQAVWWMDSHHMGTEVAQIQASRTRVVGDLRMLVANNPVFLATGSREAGRDDKDAHA